MTGLDNEDHQSCRSDKSESLESSAVRLELSIGYSFDRWVDVMATEYSPIESETSSSDTTRWQSTNSSHKSRDVVSSSCPDQLTDKPLVKFKLQVPHPRPRKLYEGDALLLDEASDESFGASEMAGSYSDVQEWLIDVFATGPLAGDRNFSSEWCSIHEIPPLAQ
jgi:hypothetical protein